MNYYIQLLINIRGVIRHMAFPNMETVFTAVIFTLDYLQLPCQHLKAIRVAGYIFETHLKHL